MQYMQLLWMLLLTPLTLNGQQYHIDVSLLKDNIYLYHSYADYEGNKVGANGLIIELKDSVVVVDTPWDDFQTEGLVNWVKENLKKPISCFVITHAHVDRIGGISFLKKNRIASISSRLTAEEAVKAGFDRPDALFEKDTLLHEKVRVFYPGAGHTSDNTVVYIENVKMLYGGCFLKSANAKNLGNLADANVMAWPGSIQAMKAKFPDAEMVIPGHGVLKKGAVENTIKLLTEH